MHSLNIVLRAPQTPLLQRLQSITARHMAERGWPQPLFDAAGSAALELALAADLPPQGFRIENRASGGARIAAADERGLYYGMGHWLRHGAMDGEKFIPCAWRGTSAPACDMRGIYFATHFHNFYQEAPLPVVERYIEELALWGLNALVVWFDMSHFNGIDDPSAASMLARLKALIKTARRCGMSAGLGMLANEGYRTTPERLRATKTGRAHYGVEICVATAEGEALVLDNRRRMLEEFCGAGIDLIWLWPYDQGGCGCESCRPWGARGMIKTGEKVARLYKSMFPGGKVIFSTWLFDYGTDQGEWQGLASALASRPDWVDYILADSHTSFPRFPLEQGVPGNLPLLNFPEISMFKALPWGGFGANPAPHRFAGLWSEVQHIAAGGFPYSEGIFEDFNKVLYAHFYWHGHNDWRNAIAAYAQAYLGVPACDSLYELFEILEANHGPVWIHDNMLAVWGYPGPPQGSVPLTEYQGWHRFPPAPTADPRMARRALRICNELETRMAPWAASSWRWRIIKLRATLDAELLHNGGAPTNACHTALRELETIYHAAGADLTVSPPGFNDHQRIEASADHSRVDDATA